MKFITLLSAVIVFVSCQSTPKSSGMTTEQLAAFVCKCSQPIVAYNDELRALAAADNMRALSQKMIQGDQIMETAINCITDQIEQKHKNLLNERLNLLIDERCHLDKRMTADLIQKVSEFEIPTY